ncbi:MAG: 1-(5-phosphoribosyl)-5-[(5-phosphoribosylamino)methylideneamino]imidazole-4-carboxamide isomerase [Oscillospiraceae bacterium]|jgi:phosphoribosylformimino-5-aminoimidazole carboxamide ribotide isomerase|nr:1-(5-phosphoribosyl)-5-[(5-phosphoribosylamino)methylideneamino]imidazole-4-carboxamide isomerase [Oscillospiraceae bacterium]
MLILPAIDLYGGRAVRLTRGDYSAMTVYDDDPGSRAAAFRAAGAEWLHIVDLEGARGGLTPAFEVVRDIIARSGLRAEVGGGIRDFETAEKYLSLGAERVILGTAAAQSPELVRELTGAFGDKIAVGADIRDGFVAVRGWTELTERRALDFCLEMQSLGVRTIICTDISRDGMLSGSNLALYGELTERLEVNLIASGGVSSLEDVCALRDMGLHGAILGKVLYEGGLDLAEAIKRGAGNGDKAGASQS